MDKKEQHKTLVLVFEMLRKQVQVSGEFAENLARCLNSVGEVANALSEELRADRIKPLTPEQGKAIEEAIMAGSNGC